MTNDDQYVIRHAVLQASKGNAREAIEAFEAMLKELAQCKLISESRDCGSPKRTIQRRLLRQYANNS